MLEERARGGTAGGWDAWRRWLARVGRFDREPEAEELRLAAKVGELERAWLRLSDDELRERGARYRRAVRVGTPVGEVAVEMLALLRELARRELGVRASDAQIAAAFAIQSGVLAQLDPGEGKSLACLFAVALAALEGRGAHLLCADPFLARRAALRAAGLFDALELRVAVLEPQLHGGERRKAYSADVLFSAADEIARDALADALADDGEPPLQARLHAAIADDWDALWLEPAGARWVARDPARSGAPPLGAIPRARIPDLYARWGGASSIACGLGPLLDGELERTVIELPPARASGRLDHPDVLFTHAAARDRALVESVARAHVEGRPLLIAAADAQQSAQLAQRLRSASVRCSVLEERPGEVNAAVLERAGAPGAVTLAIRGVDRGIAIPLGRGVAALGGLCVLATSRPGIDLADQPLRGWAGQRGAPGATRFYLSLDDAQTFGPEAAGRLSRRWRDVRHPGAIGGSTASRELGQLLAERERERRAGLAAFAGCTRLLAAQRRIADERRRAAEWVGQRALAVELAWSAHLERSDRLRCELAQRGRGSDRFAEGAARSFAEFLEQSERDAADAEGAALPRCAIPIELEIDPALRA
jgi:preprotein translocase subunit SecA